ncbi:MAG: hypothetical protein ACI8P7_001456, partial [Candidatus Azotimanducaceae bacterium]
MWRSPSIWVQTRANASYSPDPFPTNTPPPWAIDAHENPEYRETKFSTPNWIYVKVSNRGSVATMGNEKLEVYWAKASTGLAWPTHWKDYYATPDGCAERLFLGEQATKTRKNVAELTPRQRKEYTDAIQELDARFYNDDISWWDKQDDIHQVTHVHEYASFLPWHRELINRYELLLREITPHLRLHYWDWTTDPRKYNGVNLFDNDFMGT